MLNEKKPFPKAYMLDASLYGIFLTWQNWRNGGWISGCPGLTGWSRRTLGVALKGEQEGPPQWQKCSVSIFPTCINSIARCYHWVDDTLDPPVFLEMHMNLQLSQNFRKRYIILSKIFWALIMPPALVKHVTCGFKERYSPQPVRGILSLPPFYISRNHFWGIMRVFWAEGKHISISGGMWGERWRLTKDNYHHGHCHFLSDNYRPATVYVPSLLLTLLFSLHPKGVDAISSSVLQMSKLRHGIYLEGNREPRKRLEQGKYMVKLAARLHALGDSYHRDFSPAHEGQLILLCPNAWVPEALFIVNWWGLRVGSTPIYCRGTPPSLGPGSWMGCQFTHPTQSGDTFMTLRQLVELSQNVPPEWEEVKMNNTFATGSTVVTEAPSRGHPLGLALQIPRTAPGPIFS